MTPITWRDPGEMEVWLEILKASVLGGRDWETALTLADNTVMACRDRRPVLANNVTPIKQ